MQPSLTIQIKFEINVNCVVRKYQNPGSILNIFWQTYYRAWLEWLGKLQTEQCFIWPDTVYLHSITSYYCRPTREEYDLFDHCKWVSGEEGRRQKSFEVVGEKKKLLFQERDHPLRMTYLQFMKILMGLYENFLFR